MERDCSICGQPIGAGGVHTCGDTYQDKVLKAKTEISRLKELLREMGEVLQGFAPFRHGSMADKILNRPEVRAIMEEKL